MESSNKAVDSTNSITPEDALTQLRTLRAQIPGYTQEPAYPTAVLRAAAQLDPAFIDASTGAIGASAELQQALGTTSETCVADNAEASRWAQVEDEIEALLKGVRNANRTRKHRIGIRAMQAYQITKQFVRVSAHADLRPHLAEMQKHNRFGKGRRKAGQPVPSPAPAPQTDAM